MELDAGLDVVAGGWAGNVGARVSAFLLLLQLLVKGILLIVLLFGSVVLLGSVVVVSVFSSVFFVALALTHRLHAMHRVHFLLLGNRICVLRSLLHQTDRFVVVKIGRFLVVGSVLILRRVVIVLGVIFFLENPFGPVVSFFIAPSKGEMGGASRCLDNLFISLAIKIGVVSYVFIEHGI